MKDTEIFVDYYKLMQVDPSCDIKIIENAYRYLAKLYHPDHAKTADVGMFTELTKAYGVLRDPEKRADYDRSYFTIAGKGAGNATLGVDIQEDQKNAVKDAEMHHNILLALYKRRREHPKDPGLSGWLLQELLHCSEDNLEFHVWYLKSSGYIDNTEQGTLAITIQGVDRVISTSRNTLSEKLLIAQLAEPDS